MAVSTSHSNADAARPIGRRTDLRRRRRRCGGTLFLDATSVGGLRVATFSAFKQVQLQIVWGGAYVLITSAFGCDGI